MSVRIVAEVAQGYEGKLDYCQLYVEAARRASADAVKFQIVFADDVAQPGYEYYEWFRQLEMPVSAWQAVRGAAREAGLAFYTDVSGKRALEIARAIGPEAIKLHSSNFFNRPLLDAAYEAADEVLMSIGGIAIEEVDDRLEDLAAADLRHRTVVMAGFQAEPMPIERTMLARLPALKARYPDVALGFMDHVAGDGPDRIHVSAMAQALGADLIEKHLTLSRHLGIEDSVSALEPDEFADYVATLRRLESALGSADLCLSDEERTYRDKAVKKLVAAADLAAGQRLGASDIAHTRTPRLAVGAGFHDPAAVLGRTMAVDLAAGDPLTEECFQ